jgi:cell division protein FtsW
MKNRPDYILFGVVITLVILGSLIITTVSAPFSLREFNNTYHFLVHQIIYGLIPGIILAIIFFKIPLSYFKKIAPILFILSLVLLTFVFLPKIGLRAGGASRWLNLGVAFQPSEFLKLTLILYLSALVKKSVSSSEKKEIFLPFLVVLGIISLILIFQPDISTLGIILLIALFIYFAAKTPFWHSILIIFAAGAGIISLIKIAPYRFSRLFVFLFPEIDPLGLSYQIKQALIAIGSGGWKGVGPGMSVQKFGFLPHPMSDSIFAIFAEETGFIGCFFLIFLFLIFIWRGLRISKRSVDKFSQLVALAITCWIGLQAFINIGSLTGILPLTGIPLPFISYGGSHLVAELMAMGILLNISKHQKL